MTDVVVEVGPGTVRGPKEARAEWVSAALDCIDDDIALIDDRPVAVDEVWQDVISAVVGDVTDTVVVVHPTWWPSSWVKRVREAAHVVAATVVAVQRTQMLRVETAHRGATIVEIVADFVVVSHPDAGARVVARTGRATADAEAVAAAVARSRAVLVDAPAGVAGAEGLGAAIADRLRAASIRTRFADEDSVRRAAVAAQGSARPADVGGRPSLFRDRGGVAVAAGVVSAVVLCGSFAIGDDVPDPGVGIPSELLVEGRVGVMVPADWSVRRITSGPGSARVQAVSPSDADVALNVTQSAALPHPSLASTANSLGAALSAEPDGVFVDFNPSDRRAGMVAVTYREIRQDHHVVWAVLVDGTVRIAIGCQSAPGREHLVRDACDRAIGSAHAIP